MKSHLLSAAMLAGWLGCGDDAASQCQKACQKATACGGPDFLCSPQCATNVAKWRPDFRDPYFNCYLDGKTTNCANDSGICDAMVAQSLQPRSIDSSFRDACTSRWMACMSSWDDQDCGKSTLFDTSVVEQAMACLGKPCDQILSCLQSVFGS